MGNWQWWLRSQLRRFRDSEFTQRTRYFLSRHPHSPKKIIIATFGLLSLLYIMFSSSSRPALTVSEQCLAEKLRGWENQLESFSVGRDEDGVSFIGNGHIGVGDDGQLYLPSGKTLGMQSGFFPVVSVKVPGSANHKTAVLTDFVTGKLTRIQCFAVNDGCACVTTKMYAHRTKPSILVQDVLIANPNKARVVVHMRREESALWKPENDRSSKESPVLVREELPDKNVGSIICSSYPTEVSVQQGREESFRFICAVDSRTRGSDALYARRSAVDAVTTSFNDAKITRETLDRDHESAWAKLNEATFYLSNSLAPNVLNGILINATRYSLVSNSPAPLLEEGVSPVERANLEEAASHRDLCYTGHSTLLFPSRLWQPAKSMNGLCDSWLLTLEKRGCASLMKTGASGVVQAFVLSLAAGTFHDGHIEIGIDPTDLHREIAVAGIEMNDSSRSKLNFQVRLDEENKPYLIASSRSELYACDAGCIDAPVRIEEGGTRMAVKLTRPLTSILYVASNRRHLEQLRSAIHVSEVDEAPAHGHDIINLHKNGESKGGLPYWFWFFLAVLLITFHVFLIKLLYSEWRKGDSLPLDPYLRQRYAYLHKK